MINHKHIHRKIHGKLRKHSPEAVKKVKKIFSFRYPKLILLVVLIILAAYLFSRPFMVNVMKSFNQLGYFGVLISGALTSFGLTAPFGVGILMSTISKNFWIAVVVGAIGATVADLLIFKTLKFSFADEFKKLEKTKVIQEIEYLTKKNKHVKVVHYLLYLFAGILLVTPLPDEIGVSMLAGLTTIKPLKFSAICFFTHIILIFVLLSL